MVMLLGNKSIEFVCMKFNYIVSITKKVVTKKVVITFAC